MLLVITLVVVPFSGDIQAMASTAADLTKVDMLTESPKINVEPGVKTTTIGVTDDTYGVTDDTYGHFTGDRFKVEFKIDSQWKDAFNGNITITNTSNAAIENWALKFDMQNEITNIWDASIENYKHGVYLIKNNTWNQDIPVGGSVSFGFTAKGDKIDYPTSYSIPVASHTTNNKDYSVNYTLKSDWGTGFSAGLVITNNSKKEMKDWVLEFDFDKEITEIWNGVIEEHAGAHYVIKNATYNQNIAPGQTVSIGFTGKDGNVINLPSNYKLRESSVGGEYITVSTDDPVIGKAYYQELNPKDIIIELDGIQYAKNQLNLVGTMNSQFIQFEELGKQFGFEIVGYIDFTKDYQIKFNEDKSYQQLKEHITVLSQYDFIEEANLNLVTAIGTDSVFYPTTDAEWPASEWETVPQGINWGVEAINAPEAWHYRDEMYPVKIGLIDNMFDNTHEDLRYTKIWNNPRDSYVSSGHPHGTHVSGTMAAGFDNGKGITGISVKNELYAYSLNGEVTDEYSRKINTHVMEYKYAFALLIGNHVRVINVSMNTGREVAFAASKSNGNAMNYINLNAKILGTFLKRLVDRGYDYVIVTAAGNVNAYEYLPDSNATYGYIEVGIDTPGSESGGALAEYNSFLNSVTDVRDRIIVVGSYGLNENNSRVTSISDYSNIGPRVDIAAPGDEIYSTITGNGYESEGWKGTSFAAPHVAGSAALVYSINPALTGTQVKNIILSTANPVGLKEKWETRTYDTVNAGEAVKKARATKGNSSGSVDPTGIILGIVQKDGIFSSEVLDDVMVSAYKYSADDGNTNSNSGSIIYENVTSTNSNGEFELVLDVGTYNIQFYKSGYLPLVVHDVEVEANEVIYLEKILVKESWLNSILDDKAYGVVRNAITGEVLSDVTIKFREGWNKKHGDYVNEMATTNTSGQYEVTLDRGYYTVELSKEGYITGYANIVTTLQGQNQNQDAVLSPVLAADEYRIVLTWGSNPSDLDSHLYGTTNNYSFHVYYANRSFINGGRIIAELDVDDTSSYGPETVTMTARVEDNGMYRYAVHDYSNRNSATSKALSLSGASVKVYKGNSLLETFHVPTNKPGVLWTVFEIEYGKIKRVDTLN